LGITGAEFHQFLEWLAAIFATILIDWHITQTSHFGLVARGQTLLSPIIVHQEHDLIRITTAIGYHLAVHQNQWIVQPAQIGVLLRLSKLRQCVRGLCIEIVDLDLIAIHIGNELFRNQRGLLRRPTRASAKSRAVFSGFLSKHRHMRLNHVTPPTGMNTLLGYSRDYNMGFVGCQVGKLEIVTAKETRRKEGEQM